MIISKTFDNPTEARLYYLKLKKQGLPAYRETEGTKRKTYRVSYNSVPSPANIPVSEIVKDLRPARVGDLLDKHLKGEK